MKEETIEQSAQSTLDEDAIRELVPIRAYELFLSRGGEHGHDLDDWLQAKQDVLTALSETESLKAQEADHDQNAGSNSEIGSRAAQEIVDESRKGRRQERDRNACFDVRLPTPKTRWL